MSARATKAKIANQNAVSLTGGILHILKFDCSWRLREDRSRQERGEEVLDGDGPHVEADDAIVGLAGWVVVCQRVLALVEVENHALDGFVGAAGLGHLAVGHDGVHHLVPDRLHLAGVQVVSPGCLAAEADPSQVGHLADELDAGDGLGAVEVRLFDDLRHGCSESIVRFLVQWLRDRGLSFGGASGHAVHLIHNLLFPGWVQLGQDYKLLRTTMQDRCS